MSDLRGIPERLAAGEKAEADLRALLTAAELLDESTILLAKQATAAYEKRLQISLPQDIGWAGDPLPQITALKRLIHLAEMIRELKDQHAN